MQKLIGLENRFEDFISTAKINYIHEQLKILDDKKAEKTDLEQLKDDINNLDKKFQENIDNINVNIDESFDRSSASVLRKRDRIRITLERLTHARKKAEKEEDEIVDDAVDNKIEDMVEDEIKVEEVKPKRRRGRPRKKPVPSLATAGRKKKKDGENND